ncbi:MULTISPECIES: glycerol-3-phosphate dehydrogenase [unclassified Caulobacter]|uniref:glycerol-3-phosphate dehydrogenase n=1 Tax=unclassified Caulobacter TaxID=2648921 RepID=UPI000702176B|nr:MULTISPECIES: glycerol-3-phosphate dehydrogenase [unclassified Caulobacter]KQV57340.1 glycerol-3-phosphate dehydrogenase [Caulobacter sp. Root342]KQV66912.1 glycerol-3-phosphate dehydrogenase [Caulobacter sp. Root343]
MEFDLLVVGGGVNGAGVARDAAGRGLSVLLVEQNDLASATSSASTKLVHGGLRYLEYYEFRLVREALEERETLLAMAPHIIWPLRFVLPHANATRPAWMVRLGLFLYDHIGGRRRLPGSRGLSLKGALEGAALRPDYRRAFAYSDCWVDDARLVTLNAVDARERGAVIETRTKLVSAHRVGATWEARLQPADGPERQVRARAIVNAAGPWVSELLSDALKVTTGSGTRLIKGSHIVVPRLFEGEHAYMLQNPDRRIVFAIPYEGRFTLVGTTDVAWDAPPGPAQINPEEVDYLCESINRYFVPQTAAEDVMWSYAGVRPLFDDNADSASAVTRDYVLEVDAPEGQAPVLSVFGGKITTYRRLAGQAMDRLAEFFPEARPSWTRGAVLPGGDLPDLDRAAFGRALRAEFPFLPDDLAARLVRSYGTRARRILADARSLADLGEDLGAGLHAAEVDYLVANEWARTAEDILYRRSKLGLHRPPEAVGRLEAYLKRKAAPPLVKAFRA